MVLVYMVSSDRWLSLLCVGSLSLKITMAVQRRHQSHIILHFPTVNHGIWKIHDVTTIQTIYLFQPQLRLPHAYHWFTGPPGLTQPQGISPEWPGLLRSWSTPTPSVESSSWTTSVPGGDAARILSLDSGSLCSQSDMRDKHKQKHSSTVTAPQVWSHDDLTPRR